MNRPINPDIDLHGFAIAPKVIGDYEVEELVLILGPVKKAGRRGLLEVHQIASFAKSSTMLDLVRPYFPSIPLPIRALYFDKTQETNWLVPWHQDLTITVCTRMDLPGFGPWSIKDGIHHVQPPVELLQQILTVRVHLDDVDESNGALRVISGSHQFGRLSAERIQNLCREQPEVLCAVVAGGALLMRPLLLHSSRRTVSTGHRRVLHIEYAAFELPGGLQWNEVA